MIYKTRGIVFRFTKFRETSIIVTIFTDQFGLQTYIVNGVRSKNSKNKIALYQPLTLLNLVVYHRENANIERIKEIQCLHPYTTLLSDMRKSAIAMFINELLNKTVKEESHAKEIFDFIFDSLVTLDGLREFENFHMVFMVKLSQYLGFGIQHSNQVIGGHLVDAATESLLAQLIAAGYDDKIKMMNSERRVLIDLLVDFYTSHFENLKGMKSLQVLREVLS